MTGNLWFQLGDRVQLRRSADATGTVDGFSGEQPVIRWDPDAAPYDTAFRLRGRRAAIPSVLIDHCDPAAAAAAAERVSAAAHRVVARRDKRGRRIMKRRGPRPVLDADQLAAVQSRVARGEDVRDIAAQLRIGSSTLYRYLARARTAA